MTEKQMTQQRIQEKSAALYARLKAHLTPEQLEDIERNKALLLELVKCGGPNMVLAMGVVFPECLETLRNSGYNS